MSRATATLATPSLGVSGTRRPTSPTRAGSWMREPPLAGSRRQPLGEQPRGTSQHRLTQHKQFVGRWEGWWYALPSCNAYRAHRG